MRMVALTKKRRGSEDTVWLVASAIAAVGTDADGDTCILMASGQEIFVAETPRQVVALLLMDTDETQADEEGGEQ